MPIIDRDVSAAFAVGQGSAGLAAAALTSDAFVGQRAVTILPDVGISGTIYFGPTSAVTAANGCRVPVTGITIPFADPSAVFVIADAAAQTYSWMAS